MQSLNNCAISFADNSNEKIRWSWACRILDPGKYIIDTSVDKKPRVGDLVLVKIDHIGYHKSIMMTSNKKLRIYENDLIVGVFGNRYATEAFEGLVSGADNLCMLTAGGMVGTLKSKHNEIAKPTAVSFVGFLNNDKGKRINLKELKFHKSMPKTEVKNLIVIVGTGMDSGKTTVSSKLIKGLSEKEFRISACKLTGSVSNRDQDEMRSASAKCIIDFSDYGFPSTYLCSKEDLKDLFYTILFDAEKINPDAVLMEVADGVLQRETYVILSDISIKKMIKGIILTADGALSALYATNLLQKMGYHIIAVSGAMTSSPLSVSEFRQHSQIPVVSSADSGYGLVDVFIKFIEPTVHTGS